MGDYNPKGCQRSGILSIILYVWDRCRVVWHTGDVVLFFKISEHTIPLDCEAQQWPALQTCSSDPLCTLLNLFRHLVVQFAFLAWALRRKVWSELQGSLQQCCNVVSTSTMEWITTRCWSSAAPQLHLESGDVSQIKLLRGAGLQGMCRKRQMVTYNVRKWPSSSSRSYETKGVALSK